MGSYSNNTYQHICYRSFDLVHQDYELLLQPGIHFHKEPDHNADITSAARLLSDYQGCRNNIYQSLTIAFPCFSRPDLYQQPEYCFQHRRQQYNLRSQHLFKSIAIPHFTPLYGYGFETLGNCSVLFSFMNEGFFKY